jgi:2-phosphosulfolactate phosphatase
MHVEWGSRGLREVARLAEVVVVVDVLSFSTAVAVATERGALVHPHRAVDAYAVKVAARLGAYLAGPRGEGFSLSPPSLADLREGDRLVLPSPNGGALSLEAAAAGATVVAGSLRNASAVGEWLARQERRMAVVAAGEQWRDGAFRVATEDLLGAGAVLAALPVTSLSAEARLAVNAFRASRDDLVTAVRECTSGRELAARGYSEDALWAGDLDASPVVPVLTEGAFRAMA